ncbi:MAG: hypothetical protein RBT69_00465 [Spirochaetia bacterium]|jgi:hypothetical protein|nr:hypothetical protein [Spirochaetia bacterium]
MKNKNFAILGILSFILIEISSASQLAGYEPFSGNIYLAGTDKGVLLFQHKNSLETDGSRTVLRHVYSHPDGRSATTEEVVVLKMEIANFFIRLFVDPVDLVYDLNTKRLIEIHGKSLLQREADGKIENPVVDIYYNYGVLKDE